MLKFVHVTHPTGHCQCKILVWWSWVMGHAKQFQMVQYCYWWWQNKPSPLKHEISEQWEGVWQQDQDRSLVKLVSAGPVVWTSKRLQPDQTAGCSCMLFKIKNCQRPSTTGLVAISCNWFWVLLKNPHILSLFWRETAQKCMRYGQNDMLQQNPTLCNVL